MIATTSLKEQPLYFGPADRQLFGCYHAPAASADRNFGLVLCNPLGHEAIRAHRALRQLAIRLAQSGFAVLRFDYFGCGDSAGEDEQGNVATWLADIGLAVEWLQEHSGVPRLGLAGLRLGGALAALYGARQRGLTCLALWEPVVSGRAHLAELAAQHQETLWRYARQPAAGAAAEEAATELLGFPLPAVLKTELEQLDLLALSGPLALSRPPARAVLVVNRQTEPDAARLAERLAALGARTQHQVIAGPTIWKEDVDKALVPHPTLQGLVAWLEEMAV